jgi:hypothetical protein
VVNRRAFPPNHLHERWRDTLYWDTKLEQCCHHRYLCKRAD